MKTIQEAAKLIQVIVGKQEVLQNKKYRLLKFCSKVTCDEGTLIFNNLTKELVLLDQQEIEKLTSNSLIINDSFLEVLAEKWFLVPEDYLDYKLSLQITSFSRMISDKRTDIVNYTILPTTLCNARCFYCYEANCTPITMDEKIATASAKFIVENCKNKKVSIRWFGGEPLCNHKAIDTILNYLRENNVDFVSSMVSNGYLFTEEIINKAVNEWNLKNIQITLDGTEEIYNKVKNYKNSDSSAFLKVIKNIGQLLDNNVSVTIRLNMDSHNSEDLFKLVEFLHQKFNNKSNLHVYAHLLFENEGFEKVTHTTGEKTEIGEKYLSLCKYINSLSLLKHKVGLKNTIKNYFCMYDNPSSIVIFPSGKLGRCEHLLEGDYVGDIFNGVKSTVKSDYRTLEGKCFDCPSFPNCVILNNCPTTEKVCYDFLQEEKLIRLNDLILSRYKEYKLSHLGGEDNEL